MAFQLLSFVLAMYILHRRFNLEPFVLFLLPMCPFVGLMLVWGQDTGFVFLCVVAALELSLRDRQGIGGGVLALGLIKWNQLWLFPAMMLVQRRYRMFAGFTAVALVEIGLSIWVPGRDGLMQYLAEYDNPAAHYWETAMQSVYGLLLEVGIPRAVGLTVTAALIGVFLYHSRNLNLVNTFAALGVAGPLLAMHTMGYDLLFALVPIAIFGSEFRTSYRGLAAVVYLSPLPYFLDKVWSLRALRTMIFVLGAIVLWDVFRRQERTEPSTDLQPAT